MDTSSKNRLIYRRQYILSPGEINCPFDTKLLNLTDNYRLYYHRDLSCVKSGDDSKQLVLLGDIYDSKNIGSTNQDILNILVKGSLDGLYEKISKLAGRFVLIYSEKSTLILLTDASAARKVFYTKTKDGAICASTQHLLAEVTGAEPSTDPSVLSYYQSNEFKINFLSNIGDTSYYTGIKQLLPNHYLDLRVLKVHRFWPSHELEYLSEKDCVLECASMIKGFVEAAAKRYPLMIPISSGYDSRIILAASKDIKHDILYYLNDSKEVRTSADGRIHKKILSDQKLDYNLLQIEKDVDEDFKEVYLKNNKFSNPEFLEIIYNYYLKYQDKLNLPGGVIPVVKALYHSSTKDLTGSKLAKLHKYDKFQYAIEFYSSWLEEAKLTADKTKTDIFDLLYWEDKTCNWAMGIQQDKDIAQEDFLVFNSAYLVSRMLTFDISRRRSPYYKLNKEIIKVLWPELLKYPFNPSPRNNVKRILISLGMFRPIQNVRKNLLRAR